MNKTRKKYPVPRVEKIKLDRDISIQMTSTPPGDPFIDGENDQGTKNPFK